MAFSPPTMDKIGVAFPEFSGFQEIARGGFKVVYRAQVGGATEIFKLVNLPVDDGSEERKAYRQEREPASRWILP